MENIEQTVKDMALAARKAALDIANLSAEKKNAALLCIAKHLRQNTSEILKANTQDVEAAKQNGLSRAMVDRLTLSEKLINSIAEGVEQVASLENPTGRILSETKRPNGLVIKKVSVPIGVIGIIYESRPNVTVDCAVLCLKSSNACILRGGKEAFLSNQILAKCIRDALTETGVCPNAVQFIPTADRAALNTLLKLDSQIQCIIPRGGEKLIRFVCENSTIPVIKHYKGVCNLYIEKSANLKMAKDIAVNAKCQRPSACNAAENLLVDSAIVESFLPEICKALKEKNVEIRAMGAALEILQKAAIPAKEATEDDFYTEYTDYIISVAVVDGVKDACHFINAHSSGHSDAIVSESAQAAEEFLNNVDSACVYWNASTRFTDGYEFGLGAEIGISTDRLHARGPMGLNELCSYKYKIFGTGQTR